MTTFVHCRGCGQQIHETAPTCPKCGAPQMLAATAGVAMTAPVGESTASAYSQVPWFRRRWFIILCLLTIAPVAGLIALTGPLYFYSDSAVKVLSKQAKTALYIASLFWVYAVVRGPGSTTAFLFMITSVILALIIGFRNQWPEK